LTIVLIRYTEEVTYGRAEVLIFVLEITCNGVCKCCYGICIGPPGSDRVAVVIDVGVAMKILIGAVTGLEAGGFD
jgi:hypothetical protein